MNSNVINCQVKDCSYNCNESNMCNAPTVTVSSCGCSNSKTSKETMCQTFAPKN